MRVNLPVTENEFDYPADQMLMSVTDLDSHIQYCNAAFAAVSGYSEQELVGEPHNLIRHPDMPPEAFRDMWKTIRGGRPWSAVVKNRRKNGDHYWVMANVTPIVENGKPVGYMSVRTRPTRAQIGAAEKLYAEMRASTAAGRPKWVLRNGALVRATVLGRTLAALKPDVEARMLLALCLAAATQLPPLLLDLAAPWRYLLQAGLTAAAVGAGLWWLRASIATPLRRATDYAASMAAGDLQQRLESSHGGAIGMMARSLSQLNVNFLAIVTDVRGQIASLTVATSEIAKGTADLSARTETQASSLEQTAASMHQLSESVRQNAEVAGDASARTERASAAAGSGHEHVSDVVKTISEIQQSSEKVSEIIQVIESIAFQTNILALNAAVEAARAGEQGRGFAVVAEEVRALAQRTSGAAKEVRSLILESVERVDKGITIVDEARRSMNDILASIGDLDRLIESISVAAAQQSTGISQVNDAVTQLDDVTQQNAALVEQSAAATESLREQSIALTQTVKMFKV
ncbi:MAG: PAS domain-containing protein [Burkholderiales bacterium]|nr:PAS domain-containing protein [Burkholderiales bacterium]